MTAGELKLIGGSGSEKLPDRVRDRLIESYMPLVRHIASRHGGRGESVEDLVGVGLLALVRAIDRCDPGRRQTLPAYVGRCVEGEIRRHLRDRASVVRVPRDVQQSGGRLDRVPLEGWDETSGPADDDPAEDTALTRALVASAVRCLDGRERELVLLRYFLDLSQAEVGREVGVSQVQVSRLLRRANAKMRAGLGADDGATEW